MRTLFLAAVAATAILSATPALAQQSNGDYADTTTSAATDTAPRAPDGTRAFGIVPYVGVMGGWESFDNQANGSHIPLIRNAAGNIDPHYNLDGALIEGVLGVNVPLGPVFVGAEGNVTKAVSGDIDWEYGVAGRFGVRAGDSGLIYGKVGYQWVNFAKFGDDGPDYGGVTYGLGIEAGPKDIGLKGITNNAGIRLRAEVSTFGNFHSFRPMAGVVTHF